MARKPTDVQVQVVMTKRMRKALGRAALMHQDDVPRDRMMDRGPMIRYVMSWFLERPPNEQLAVLLAGQAAYEAKYGIEDEASAGDVRAGVDERPQDGRGVDHELHVGHEQDRRVIPVVRTDVRVIDDGALPKRDRKRKATR